MQQKARNVVKDRDKKWEQETPPVPLSQLLKINLIEVEKQVWMKQ